MNIIIDQIRTNKFNLNTIIDPTIHNIRNINDAETYIKMLQERKQDVNKYINALSTDVTTTDEWKEIYKNTERIHTMNIQEQLKNSIEDYLECIYQINLGQGVKSTDIAAKLSVSKPSVHRAIVTLAEMGLLSQEKYSLIYLTEAGQKKAAEVSEKHEILSGFLQDVLGIAPDVAEEEACKMEHGVSMETVQKFNALRKKLSEKLDLETLWEKSE